MEDQNQLQPKTTSTGLSVTPKFLDLLIRENLHKLTVIYPGVGELDPLMVPLWVEALSGWRLDLVAAAFKKVISTFEPTNACKFPVPAHVLKILENRAEVNLEDEAETEWQSLLQKIEAHYHPDVGWRGPKLSSRSDHAAKAASGVHYISQCSEGDLVWAKKRFIECYLRDEKLEGEDFSPEMKQLMNPLAALKSME